MTHASDVLLVDDDPDLLKLISLRLTSAGYRVRTADSGETALAALAVQRPAAVITDLKMPGIDGLALFDAIHRQHPAMPVIILTAHGTIPEAVSATQRGVFGFLTKPFDSQELLQKVAAAVRLSGGEAEPTPQATGEWRAGIITRSPRMEDLMRQARLVADSDASVLIFGESGTGKELLARSIHFSGARHDRPFVPVNCAAIPQELFESELFGARRGAFTGATEHRRGHFQMANGGTLLLDEIGEMPLHLQSKLLRAIEERKVTSVGADRPVDIDVRFIATTNKDLHEEVERGAFRRDLFYRLSVMPVRVPPLRERPEDIPLLARHFVEQASRRLKKPVSGISPESLAALTRYAWPGNVRELENVIERAVIVAPGNTLVDVERFLAPSGAHAPVDLSLPFRDAKARVVEEFERAYIEGLLKSHGGKLTVAAKHADMDPKNFSDKMQRYGMRRATPPDPPTTQGSG